MKIIVHMGAFLSLVSLASGAAAGCTYKGKKYDNLATVKHPNGCAILQCQFGQFVTYYEACGRDIDGECKRLNLMFVYKEETYVCTKVPTADGFEYKYKVEVPKIKDCTFEGKTYTSLTKFKGKDNCREYQCQNGAVFALDAVCSSEIDGKCHLVGENFMKSGKTYNCTGESSNAVTVYENKLLYTTSPGSRSCTAGGSTFAHHQIFKLPNSCSQRQCQDKTIKILTQACVFKQDNGKCYSVGEQWTFQNKTYQCNINPADETAARAEVIDSGYEKCKRSEKWYGHLEIQVRSDGCTAVQCQNGRTPPVQEGCLLNVDNKCHDLNMVWETNGQLLKCIMTGDGLYRIIQVDENGKEIEKVPTITPAPDFGETCPTIAADIIFVWDSSGSISSGNYQRQKNFSCEILKAFKIGPDNVLVGGVIFSKNAEKVFDLNSYNDLDALCAGIQKTPFLGDVTETQKAFNLILEKEMFDPKNGGRPDIMDIVIVITDGISSDTGITLAAAGRLKAQGVQMMSIGVGQISKPELEGIASRPENVFNTSSYEAIFSLKKEISERTCNVITEPPVDPKEPNPVVCPKVVADVIFVLDSSSEVGIENYNFMLDLAINLTKELTISPKFSQAGAVLISHTGKILFDLNTHANQDSVIKALDSAPYLKEERETYQALQIANAGLFDSEHGGREKSALVAVIILGGPSSHISDSLNEAKRLRDQGVRVIAIGLDNYDVKELIGLTGDIQYVFAARTQQQLKFVKAELYRILCEVITQPRPEPQPPKCTDTFIPPCDQECENIDTGVKCSCRRGFLVNPKNKTKCDDIDECKSNPTLCEQICENTPGSYKCVCKPGYQVSQEDPSKCVDIDECSTPGTCEHTCTNTIGSFDCSCNTGYKVDPKDPTKCKDIDECATLKPCEHTCSNTDTGYTCSCKPGYVISPTDPNKCDDIDECKNNSPCQQECTNTDGSFECSCKRGYVVNPTDPNKCDDIDECKKKAPCQHDCTNTDGSYKCSCKPGYVVNPRDSTKCDDIDECKKDAHCQHDCTNTDGSYTCSCKPGYVVNPTDSTKCDDIDECKKDAPCQQKCTNTDGSYECSCKPGYVINPTDPTKCDNINECDMNSPCQQECTNTEGSYECSCKPGYVVSPTDPTKCDDIDECKKVSPCQHTCTNTDGSYTCSCKPGYVVNAADPTKCDDIDECKKDSPCQQTCTNTDGSYTCSCKPGYVVNAADPTKCDDIDECIKNSPCQQICTNKDGSYTCSCKPGYVVSATDPTKCTDINECLDKVNPPCHHKCKNTDGGYECSCREGYAPNICDPNTCKDIDECEKNPCEQTCTNTRGGYTCS